jgi:hypothetical protein
LGITVGIDEGCMDACAYWLAAEKVNDRLAGDRVGNAVPH